MKSIAIRGPGLFVHAVLWLLAGGTGVSVAQNSVTLGGSGWMQDNIIGHSSENTALDGKSVLSIGGQVSIGDRVSDRLEIKAALGIVTENTLLQATGSQSGYAVPTTDPYVSEADFTYAFKSGGNSKMWLRGGLFSYTYNPDAKDLGLYLLRGPVHPGLLVSGYETLGYLPVGNLTGLPAADVLGLQLHQQWGGFQQDFILSSETHYYPFFDFSPAYVARYQVHPSLQVGAGVNFYHLIPVDYKLTNHNYDPLDSANDISYAGTKVMATAAFDPKPLLNSSLPFGPEDLRLYGEVALIGLNDSRVYREIYGRYRDRIPVMVGFNLPVFNVLDHLSLEVEWYGSRLADNMSNFNRTSYSPYPDNDNLTPAQDRSDNWKWAVHASKTLQKRVTVTVQVADDHYRPGIYEGYGDSAPPLRPAVLVTPQDWYASAKLSFGF